MASDMISRKALLATLNDLEATGGHKYYLKGANDVLHDIMPQILADAPAVDAVEVVRCRDCENFWEYTEEHKATVENADGDCAIRKWRSDDEQFCAVTKDDYCSLARRKKDATD